MLNIIIAQIEYFEAMVVVKCLLDLFGFVLEIHFYQSQLSQCLDSFTISYELTCRSFTDVTISKDDYLD